MQQHSVIHPLAQAKPYEKAEKRAGPQFPKIQTQGTYDMRNHTITWRNSGQPLGVLLEFILCSPIDLIHNREALKLIAMIGLVYIIM